LTKRINNEIGKPDIAASNREIPVAPPSIKSFGNKKLFNPKPADRIPVIINKASCICSIKAFRTRYWDFASLYLLALKGGSSDFFFSLTTVCDINC
jgi:hypothetical protein